jgi:protein-tyrosine phosphatase
MPPTVFNVQTVCHGNICRSPMAAAVLRRHLADAVPPLRVDVTSSGVSGEETGHPVDPRAARALARRGYQVDRNHRARRISDADLGSADLILPATFQHLRALVRRGAAPDRVRLIREFDPALAGLRPGAALDLQDPWYGGDADFETALDQIEAAAPGVVEYVRELVG